MNTPAILTALVGFVIVLTSIILYFRTIPRGTAPKKVGGFAAKLWIGVGFCLVGVYLGLTGEGSASGWTYALAGFGIFFGGFILWVLQQRTIPLGEIKVHSVCSGQL